MPLTFPNRQAKFLPTELLADSVIVVVGLRALGSETAIDSVLCGVREIVLVDDTIATDEHKKANFLLRNAKCDGKKTLAQLCADSLDKLARGQFNCSEMDIVSVWSQSELISSVEKRVAKLAAGASLVACLCDHPLSDERTIGLATQLNELKCRVICGEIRGAMGCVAISYGGQPFAYRELNEQMSLPTKVDCSSLRRVIEEATDENDEKQFFLRITVTEVMPFPLGWFGELVVDGQCLKEQFKVRRVRRVIHDLDIKCESEGRLAELEGKLKGAKTVHLRGVYAPIIHNPKFNSARELLSTLGGDVVRIALHAAHAGVKTTDELVSSFEEKKQERAKKHIEHARQTQWDSAEFAPVATVLGARCAWEASKLITRLHEPHTEQLISYTRVASLQNLEDCMRNFQEKTILMVGAGALGSELLKLFVMMGAKHVIVMDGDEIAASNLHRQLLFLQSDCGKKKADVACRVAAELGSGTKLTPISANFELNYINPAVPVRLLLNDPPIEAEDIALIVAAVDNMDARRELDVFAHWMNVPMVEGGTQGFQGSAQVVVPRLTGSIGRFASLLSCNTKQCDNDFNNVSNLLPVHELTRLSSLGSERPYIFQWVVEKTADEAFAQRWREVRDAVRNPSARPIGSGTAAQLSGFLGKDLPKSLCSVADQTWPLGRPTVIDEADSEPYCANVAKLTEAVLKDYETEERRADAAFEKDSPAQLNWMIALCDLLLKVFNLPSFTDDDLAGRTISRIAGKMADAIVTMSASVAGDMATLALAVSAVSEATVSTLTKSQFDNDQCNSLAAKVSAVSKPPFLHPMRIDDVRKWLDQEVGDEEVRTLYFPLDSNLYTTARRYRDQSLKKSGERQTLDQFIESVRNGPKHEEFEASTKTIALLQHEKVTRVEQSKTGSHGRNDSISVEKVIDAKLVTFEFDDTEQ